MAALVPEAAGFLGRTPLAHLLAHALDHRLTGTLVLEETDGARHGIYFDCGAPKRVLTAPTVVHLGELLVETGTLSQSAHERTLQVALREHRQHGSVLLGEGLLSEQALGVGLREQLARHVLWLFRRPASTRFGYFHRTNFLENSSAAEASRVNVLELIWRGVRDHTHESEIDAVVGEVGNRPLKLRDDMPLDYFYFMGKDRAIVELLAGTERRVNELVVRAGGAAQRVRRVVFLLLLARALDFGVRSAPPLGVDLNSQPVVHVPPPPLLPRAELDAWLGAPLGANDDFGHAPNEPAIRVDRLSSPDLDGLSLPEPLSASPAERGAPRGERTPASGPTPAERAVAAANAFQRAEVMLKHGNLFAASREAQLALEHHPKPEYMALNAWLELQSPAHDLKKIALDLRRAQTLAENSPTVRYYRGLVLQRLGKHAAALREFRGVLQVLPGHVDAARQVRVYEQRLRRSPKDRPSLAPEDDVTPSTRGLFGWLGKRGN